MKKSHLILIAIFLCSTNYSFAGEITGHQIVVPEEFAFGRDQEAFEGTSPIDRYVDAYEKTWWRVMNSFVDGKPDWKNFSNFICSGTPAASQACVDAHDATSKKLESLLKIIEKDKLQAMIKPYLSE